MAKEKDDSSVFNVAKIRELIELMQEHELREVDLQEAEQRIRLKRGGSDAPVVSYAQPPVVAAAASPPPAAATPAAVPADDSSSVFIKSPTIGTFYSRPKPDASDFVKVGDVVTPDTIVCLVEAMKMFNEIPAGVSGKIVACLVNNEDPVDANKPLFKVEPN